MAFLELFTAVGWMGLAALILGMALVIFEMFVPGFGIPGITGIILIVVGLCVGSPTVGVVMVKLCVVLAVLGLALVGVLRSVRKGKLSKILVLNDRLKAEEGYSGTEDLEFFLHKEGTTLTVLRPAGTADFDGVKLDVVSESEYIPVGTRIRVIQVSGRRIVVRRIVEAQAAL